RDQPFPRFNVDGKRIDIAAFFQPARNHNRELLDEWRLFKTVVGFLFQFVGLAGDDKPAGCRGAVFIKNAQQVWAERSITGDLDGELSTVSFGTEADDRALG